LRWVQTDDVSSGATQPLLAITPIANSTNFTGAFGDVSPVSVKNSYHDLLPSLNATYRFSPDLQLRFAVSKTITRPSFTQLGPDISWEINSPPPRATQNGNPRLKPIKSNNVDLSLEWYGSRGNAFSAAYFGKNIHDFITSGSYTEQVLGYTVQITSPVNGDSAKINGGEIAYQQLYDNGLGYQLNYTYVDNVAYTTVNGVTVKTGLDGVSRNTYNITGLYEKGPWSARLSYSYRGGYVDCASCGPTGGGNPAGPTSVEKAGFLDFSGSYQINPTYTVYLDGTNLTGESLHRYAGDLRYTEYYEKYATRYEFGVRAKW
jgi:TonB-dependent receptor